MSEPQAITLFKLAQLKQQQAWVKRGSQRSTLFSNKCFNIEKNDSALITQSTSQKIGSRYETQALEWLQKAGLVPLARNLSCRFGEIDLIMRDGTVMVFVEVRARANSHYGGAAASVGYVKQKCLSLTAKTLLPQLKRLYWQNKLPPCRFDVIAFEANGLHWLKAAFEIDSN